MSRFASTILLLAGSVGLLIWVAGPASSAPQSPVPATPAPTSAPAPSAPPDASGVEPLHLDTPTRAPVPYVPPNRDPFSFAPAGGRDVTFDAAPVTEYIPEPPRTRLPSLIAIVADRGDATDGTSAAPSYRAVLSTAGPQVRVVSTGDDVAGLRVGPITARTVTLSDAAGATFDLSLR